MCGHGVGNSGSEAADTRHDNHQETIVIVRRHQGLFSRSRKDTIARCGRGSENISLLVCVVTFCIGGESLLSSVDDVMTMSV
jgi:hypothetical protein